MLDARYWMLDAGFWPLVTGYWSLVSGYWFLVTGFWLLVTGRWKKMAQGTRRTAKLKPGPRLKREKAFMKLSLVSYVLWFILTSTFRIPKSQFRTLSSVFFPHSAFRIPNSKLCLLFFTTETAR